MSIAIINCSVGGSLAVAGPTTLSGSLLSSGSLCSQGMTTKALNVNDIILNGNVICILPTQTTGINNLILGASGGASNLTSGSNNVGIGFQPLEQLITGSYNTALGFQAGSGILGGSENICIGRNSGITPSNSYNQSVCVGINSQIAASNQISLGTSNETVQIPGQMSIGGQVNLVDTPLYLRSNDMNHSLQYNAGVDGPSLQGYSGGKLGTVSNSSILTWNTNSTTINCPLSLAENPIYFRSNNTDNLLVFSNDVQGPALQGYNGGKLGSSFKSDVITWNTYAVTVNCPLSLSDKPLYLRNDTNNSLQYNSTIDGPALRGNGGGKLGTLSNASILTWNNQLVNINLPLEMSINTGSIRMNGSTFYFGPNGDSATFLQYNTTTTGVSLQSTVGGKIGTTVKSDIITWNSSTSGVNTVGLNGNVQLSATGEIRMNLAPLYLKTTGDDNHVLRYVGGAYDGPSLQGASGGTLRTVSNAAVLTWSNTSVNVNLPLISNTNIQESTSGFFANFYRKTNCTTSETYNFQSAHGKYDVYYNANHDKNTSSFHHIDILNNVNGGSFVAQMYRGSGVTVVIDPNTNILTITSTVSGGTILINRVMAYY